MSRTDHRAGRAARALTPILCLGLGLASMVPSANAQQSRTESDAPTAAEQARIETVLRDRGFVRWKEIEREDNGRTWEVDDAFTADGKRFDLRLSADDLREIARHAEE